MMENEEKIIARIKRLRLIHGLTYQQLADRTGLTKSTLQRYETGAIKNIPLDRLEALANGLGVSGSYLLGWTIESQLDDLQDQIDAKNRELAETSDSSIAERLNNEITALEDQYSEFSYANGLNNLAKEKEQQDPETKAITEELQQNTGLRLLLNEARKLTAEQLLELLEFAQKMQKQ